MLGGGAIVSLANLKPHTLADLVQPVAGLPCGLLRDLLVLLLLGMGHDFHDRRLVVHE